MRCAFVLCLSLGLLFASPAAAQTTYVAGSFLGELSRFGGVDVDDDNAVSSVVSSTVDNLSRDGESVGFDLRVGRGLGEHWGIELAYARGGSVEHVQTNQLFGRNDLPGLIPGLPSLPILPLPEVEIERRFAEQHTTIDTVAWFRQDLGERVALAFLGGASFHRHSTEQSFRVTDPRLAIYATFPAAIEAVDYGVGPVVGAETLIKFGAHAAITGGVRLNAVGGGWLIRPSAGLRWTF